VAGDGSGPVRVGITHYAQDALGDIVFVQLPDVGDGLESGQAFGEVESTKSVSDVYAPVSGEVKAKNEALDSTPELVNSDPYGEGWLIEISVADPSALDGMLDAEAYQRHVDDH
jgi:glycine cleavage system H protein